MRRDAIRVVVAAGGTAGHLSPGIAVAEVLRTRRAEVLFIGRKGGPEQAIVAGKGFAFRGIAARGRGPGLISARNLQAAFGLAGSVAKSLGIISSFKPNVVLGAGGYVSLGPLLAARAAGIPVVVHEQNAVPGLANRIARRFAARVAVSFPGTESQFGPRAVLTGNPVRAEIAQMDRDSARPAACEFFAIDPSRKVLLVFGGSQGALHLNQAAVGAYDAWRSKPMQLLHLTGRDKEEEVRQALSGIRKQDDTLGWHTLEFSDRMDLAYAAADLAVCRAGASTIAELAAVGLPAILVPLPISLDDDQRRNAEAAGAAGGARMVLQSDLDSETLARLVLETLFDEALLTKMGLAMKTLARPDAAAKLAGLVWEAAKP